MSYIITTNKKNRFISLILLHEIIQYQEYPSVKLEGEDSHLESILTLMVSKGLLEIKKGKFYPTELGRQELEQMLTKYQEYLKIYDIFCAVDLEKGEFAFSSINDIENDDEWYEFLADERFSDVRVAVAQFKGLDPTEIVFMSFLNEGRFSIENENWQFNLVDYKIWDEIEEICETAISKEYLEKDDVLVDVIRQGSEIALELIRQAEETDTDDEEETITTTTTEITEETEDYIDVIEEPYYPYGYWEPYYDPFYISPVWIAAAIIIW